MPYFVYTSHENEPPNQTKAPHIKPREVPQAQVRQGAIAKAEQLRRWREAQAKKRAEGQDA